MDKKLLALPLVALPLAIGGFVYAASQSQPADAPNAATQEGYICPATGEELPCPSCCPLNGKSN